MNKGMYEHPAPLHYLTRDDYNLNAARQTAANELWASKDARWPYHDAAVQMAKKVPIKSPDQVLEAGSIGAQLVRGSHTIDTPSMWPCVDAPTISHDMRVLPWPIADKQYRLFIALRVWQHLAPVQSEALQEAFRIADYVLICCPQSYFLERGIPAYTMRLWGQGHTLLEEHHLYTGTAGDLYFWQA
jgi:hypothetical protein